MLYQTFNLYMLWSFKLHVECVGHVHALGNIWDIFVSKFLTFYKVGFYLFLNVGTHFIVVPFKIFPMIKTR